MVFSSSLFLVYFLPLFLLAYNLTPKLYKNWVILAFSIFFYSWGAPKFVFLLLTSTIVDYYLVNQIYFAAPKKRKQFFLILSISINVGLLLYFKYSNFFIENTNQILSNIGFKNIAWTDVILPIGISFYTFQTLTYSIDVYRGIHKPLNKLGDYLLYIMSFPQMIAGPIVRFNEIADQITERTETTDDKLKGFVRFGIGLGKKVLIANVLGEQADAIMNQPASELSFTTAWLGILCYTFQIYFDFSGYSDMAIGLGRIMGFKFPENFNNPYTSTSITNFWRKWHITLGQWMKDYLYIPLGGNRVSKYKILFNLWIVFLISGLWHGASWNFVVWGAYHGIFLVLDKLFLAKLLNKVGPFLSIPLTFFLVVIGWVFFRLETFDQATQYLSMMFDFRKENILPPLSITTKITFISAVIFSFIGVTTLGEKLQAIIYEPVSTSLKWYAFFIPTTIIVLIICLSSITTENFNPFIYFRF